MASTKVGARLSRAEYEVVLATARGETGREIAQRRQVTENTIYRLRNRAYAKLGVRSAVEVTRWAIDKGLVKAG